MATLTEPNDNELDRSFFLDQSEQVWIVLDGSVDIFAEETTEPVASEKISNLPSNNITKLVLCYRYWLLPQNVYAAIS